MIFMLSLKENKSKHMKNTILNSQIANFLNENKALNISNIDISNISDFADYMIIATASSARHLKSIGSKLSAHLKELKHTPVRMQGEQSSEWVIIDAGEIVVHIMLEEIRALYNLEELWSLNFLSNITNTLNMEVK